MKKAKVDSPQWKKEGTLLYADFGTSPSPKIAAFDLDSTLIVTKSGATFAKNASDWQFLHATKVKETLVRLHEEGHKLVIFTNQKGISKGKTSEADIKNKLSDIVAAIGKPMQVFAATTDDEFRKPCTGMFDFMQRQCNGGITIDKSASLYCGDAAGRGPSVMKKKKDFSAADWKFAMNLEIAFKTPENLFLGHRDVLKATWTFDPTVYRSIDISSDSRHTLSVSTTELVVLVGSPGSGKSSLSRRFLTTYEHVNQDILSSKDRCLKAARAALQAGKSVVVDATNRDTATRSVWIKLAKEFGVPARAIHIDIPKDLAFHMNAYRLVNPRSTDKRKVSDVVIHSFFKQLQPPTVDEGFHAVHKVDFVPGPFDCEDDRILFSQYIDE
eukprot:GILK01000439.1.p1 GENE.GILK01000439.1~~GILK01000439.1.p1  ORF type:complete len:422 (+),score=77.69 GILK01000439.1:114-1268(+)